MGPDTRVLLQYYRLPDTVLHEAKLSKVFLNLESDILASQQGRSLDEMTTENAEHVSECQWL